MNKQGSMDAESAYGSEISSNSSFLFKKDTFVIEEPTPKNQTRSRKSRVQLLKYQLRECTILEAVFFLILVFLLITCFWIIYQNQETQRMILSIQSQLNSIQKPIERDFRNMKEDAEETIKNESEKLKSTLKEDLKELIENESDKTEAKLETDMWEFLRKPVAQLEQPIINRTTNFKKIYVPPAYPTVSTYSTVKQFNAASLMAGSTIDKSLSSSSSLNSLFDQNSLVLVDRPEPPANKAWCTSVKKPVLTVSLGYYIDPTAVSYQHSKWNGTIPDDAPKEYSVEACIDEHCRKRKPLFSHCEYNQHGLQEQICNNTPHDPIKSQVGKLQFRFHKNHGNTERTCVSLVRVYSEIDLIPEQRIRRLEDTTLCLDLNHHYHKNPLIYKYFTYKNCHLLYSKGCCQECPECCDECDIQDINPDVTPYIIIGVIFGIIMAILLFRVIYKSVLEISRT